MSCAAIVSRSGADRRRDSRTPAMTRAAADVDPDNGTPALRVAGAADDEDDVGRIGVDLRLHSSEGQGFDQRVLHDATQLERRGFEIVG